jgi:hypothetical protein
MSRRMVEYFNHVEVPFMFHLPCLTRFGFQLGLGKLHTRRN